METNRFYLLIASRHLLATLSDGWSSKDSMSSWDTSPAAVQSTRHDVTVLMMLCSGQRHGRGCIRHLINAEINPAKQRQTERQRARGRIIKAGSKADSSGLSGGGRLGIGMRQGGGRGEREAWRRRRMRGGRCAATVVCSRVAMTWKALWHSLSRTK